jgi:cation transport protein ChaC
MWVFGYGSLVFRPDFPYVDRRAGFVRGWSRRFYQGSPDHRGTPAAPGRVVTLLPDADAVCWGVAFQLPIEGREAILHALDHREKEGYARHELAVHLGDGASLAALTYVATEGNPCYLGPAPLAQIAAQIAGASGPSGGNLDYLRRLAAALREMDADDPHVFELERLLVRDDERATGT